MKKTPAAKKAPAAKKPSTAGEGSGATKLKPAALAAVTNRRDGVGYWLVKIEQDVFPWDRLVREGRTVWDGVRNYTARNNLRAMKVGDLALYYHSVEGKAVMGVARILREAFRDPTAPADEDWSAVELGPHCPFVSPATLDQLRKSAVLSGLMLLRQPRLSVMAVTPAEFDEVLRIGKTVLPVSDS